VSEIPDESTLRGSWTPLGEAGLEALAWRVRRREVAYWKHLFESFEYVGLVRTVETRDSTVVIAIVVPPDSRTEAEAILADAVARGDLDLVLESLPAVCREDWFLAEWADTAE
jgi:hypothetical protein